jgi:hypothetical protein
LVSGALARCGVTSKGVLMKISPEQIKTLRDPKTRQRVYKVVYKLRFHVENDLQQPGAASSRGSETLLFERVAFS